jgi:hypothetical protein
LIENLLEHVTGDRVILVGILVFGSRRRIGLAREDRFHVFGSLLHRRAGAIPSLIPCFGFRVRRQTGAMR